MRSAPRRSSKPGASRTPTPIEKSGEPPSRLAAILLACGLALATFLAYEPALQNDFVAYDDDAYVQGLLGAGVNGYHLKDQPLSELRLAVQRVLAGERWICSPLVEKLVRARETGVMPQPLTARQREILQLIAEGRTTKAIAQMLTLSPKTVEMHRAQLMERLDIHDVAGLVRYAIRTGMISGDA